jgi:hypothetical protein
MMMLQYNIPFCKRGRENNPSQHSADPGKFFKETAFLGGVDLNYTISMHI